MDKQRANQMSPLVWAYIGDSVYELFIREYLVNTTKFKPNKLHIQTIKYVKAKSQADILKKLETILTEEELEIVKRARNTENHHLPKNAEPADYMYATAFEGLIGFLYITEQKERLQEILSKCI
jgi:ribonuclease-3 family protein